jgi:hypothetical protein
MKDKAEGKLPLRRRLEAGQSESPYCARSTVG